MTRVTDSQRAVDRMRQIVQRLGAKLVRRLLRAGSHRKGIGCLRQSRRSHIARRHNARWNMSTTARERAQLKKVCKTITARQGSHTAPTLFFQPRSHSRLLLLRDSAGLLASSASATSVSTATPFGRGKGTGALPKQTWNLYSQLFRFCGEGGADGSFRRMGR